MFSVPINEIRQKKLISSWIYLRLPIYMALHVCVNSHCFVFTFPPSSIYHPILFFKLGQPVTSPLNPYFPPPSSFPPLGIHLHDAPARSLCFPEGEARHQPESGVDNLAWWPAVTSVGRTSCMHHFPARLLTFPPPPHSSSLCLFLSINDLLLSPCFTWGVFWYIPSDLVLSESQNQTTNNKTNLNTYTTVQWNYIFPISHF